MRVADSEVEHGSYRGYRQGCRKSCCRAANTAYNADLRARRRAANPPKRKQTVVPSPVFEGPTRVVRYRYRLDVGPVAERKLVRTLGAARWVYNAAVAHLRTRDADGRFLSTKGLTTKVITEPRKRPETAWLAEPSYAVLSASVQDARQAMENYWASRTGKRAGRKMGLPSFKKHSHRGSATFARTRFSIAGGWTSTSSRAGGRLRLEKLGTVHVRWSRPLPSEPSSATVVREPDGTWWVSFVVEEELRPTTPQVPGRVAALDLGLTDLAVVAYSDGTRERIPAPRHYRQSEQKLASLQRDLSRRKVGSRNYDEARRKVAAAHRRISNLRENHARQLSARLLRENQTVVVETLSIAGLARTRMGKSVHDAGWGILLRSLREGARLRGREIVELPAFFPGSRTCAPCGTISGPKPLSVRVWSCPSCSAVLGRDYNAAVNHLIAATGERDPRVVGLASVDLAPGLRERVNARGEAVSRPGDASVRRLGAGLDDSGTDGHHDSTRCRARRRPHRHNRRTRARLARERRKASTSMTARYEHVRGISDTRA